MKMDTLPLKFLGGKAKCYLSYMGEQSEFPSISWC